MFNYKVLVLFSDFKVGDIYQTLCLRGDSDNKGKLRPPRVQLTAYEALFKIMGLCLCMHICLLSVLPIKIKHDTLQCNYSLLKYASK